MYVDGWSEAEPFFQDHPPDPRDAERFMPRTDARGLRVCDLADLPEEAQDAVLLAGALVLARLDNACRMGEA